MVSEVSVAIELGRFLCTIRNCRELFLQLIINYIGYGDKGALLLAQRGVPVST